MAAGGCFCGNIRVRLEGQPITAGLCHCYDCRKLTGSLYSYSLFVKTDDLKITGNAKDVAKTADSGNHIKNYFCPDCGTPLYGQKIDSDGVPDEVTVVRAGIFDDSRLLDQCKPKAEIFTSGRVGWISCVEGAAQFEGMLPKP